MLRTLFFLLAASVTVCAQVQKVGYSEKDDYTLLYYTVKDIDTVSIPGKWERDKRDLATSVYLTNETNNIGFYIDTKSRKYKTAVSDSEALALFVSDKIKKLRRSWDVELLSTDNATYELYKITGLRHPDGNQVALLGSRGKYTYNIVCYGPMDDKSKSEFLIQFFTKIKS